MTHTILSRPQVRTMLSSARYLRLSYVLLAGLVGMAASAPRVTRAQGQPPAGVEQGPMDAYARAFLAISSARDRAQAEFAEPKNKKPEAQAELRDKLRARIAAALSAQRLTGAQYDSITHVISIDPGQRKAFDAALARITSAKPDEPSPHP